MKWVKLIQGDYSTYPNEGIDVIVSDDIHYDIAYYVMSGEYKWLKSDLVNDDVNDFISFTITKWAYIE